MYSKISILFIAAATAGFVSAAPGIDQATYPAADPPIQSTKNVNKCNVGTLQCCKSVQHASSKAAQDEAGILGIALGSVQGLLGFQCNPISAVLGVGAGANCNASPVCCKGNKFNGLVAVGCSPINVNL